jgi:predicted ATP-dependent endonuclease of OLD family
LGCALGDLRAIRFRVQNFRNIDDSGWIDIDQVTAFVGRNESGKTALLQALQKFNPATEIAYAPQREFPRDRFQREFKQGASIPVCTVAFAVEGALRRTIGELTGNASVSMTFTATRHYNEELSTELDPPVVTPPLAQADVYDALDELSASVRRLAGPGGDDEAKFSTVKGDLLTWILESRKTLASGDFRTDAGRKALGALEKGVDKFSGPWTATPVEAFLARIRALIEIAAKPDLEKQVTDLCAEQMPVFIYFENYGILNSAVYLPEFLGKLKRVPDDPQVRTINAMFTHVELQPEEIYELGTDPFEQLRAEGKQPTPKQIAEDREKKELRAIRLSSASNDITKRFSDWWRQRRHQIRYHADGEHFRIWIADDKRPGIEIELESRSKGFQWFFSFYLVFLVESEHGHRDAVLLLDEPGLHLHPTAQHELLSFFDTLAEKNQLIYTTHSPFLVDGRRLTRVRAVTETKDGRSHVSTDLWPADRETTFPLQAALGYELAQTLFQGKRNVLVEGMTDLLYVQGLDLLLQANGRHGLPEDVYVTPSRGTKLMGLLASLYIGQGVRPLVLLDDDDAGHDRANALVKELYKGEEQSVIFVSQAVPGCAEIEDVIGEARIVPALAAVLGVPVQLSAADQAQAALVDRIQAWSRRTSTTLPDDWKQQVARRIVRRWTEGDTAAKDDELRRAQNLIDALRAGVGSALPAAPVTPEPAREAPETTELEPVTAVEEEATETEAPSR